MILEHRAQSAEPREVVLKLPFKGKWSALADRKGDLTRVKLVSTRLCEALKQTWQSTPPFVKGEVCVADRGIFSYLLNSVGGNK